MKKTVILGIMGLTLAMSANLSAATMSRAICKLPYNDLKSNGFTQGALYTDEQIKNFFKVIHIEPEDLSQLHPGVHYSLSYHCYKDKGGVAHASLHAVETPTPPGMLTPDTLTVNWEFTKY